MVGIYCRISNNAAPEMPLFPLLEATIAIPESGKCNIKSSVGNKSSQKLYFLNMHKNCTSEIPTFFPAYLSDFIRHSCRAMHLK